MAAIGGAIGLAGRNRQMTPDVVTLAVGTAASLATNVIVYAARRRFRPIYVGDAAAEAALVAAWAWLWRQHMRLSLCGRTLIANGYN